MITELKLGQADRVMLDGALKASNKRFALPPDVSTATFHFVNDLWEKIERVHPALLDAMHSMLKVEQQVAERPCLQATRMQRRDKKGAPM